MTELPVEVVDAMTEEDVLTAAAASLLIGNQKTAGVYTGIGIVIP